MPPENLKELESFLGMISHYRKFIRDYAHVANPLTTRGENAQIKANQFRIVKIKIDDAAMIASFKIISSFSRCFGIP